MKTLAAGKPATRAREFGTLPKWQTDIWAALMFLDGKKIAAAKRSLEEQPLKGIRHFSAMRRVVPLKDAPRVQREMKRLERTPGSDETTSLPIR